jgi:hypothetical protein
MKKMTDADKAKLKKLSAGKGALANGKLSMDQQFELNALKRMERQSRSYSPAPMSAAAKKKAARAGQKTQAVIGIKKDAKKIAGVAGKVAGKVAGAAKSKVKADIKAAKMVAGVASKVAKSPVKSAKTAVGIAAKVATFPADMAYKAGKALAKEKGPKRGVGKGDPLQNLINAKKAKKK